MSVGKELRLKRIFPSESNKTVIVPMDHGITLGPIGELRNIESCIKKVQQGGVNGVILHKGILQKSYKALKAATGLIVHLNASTALGRDIQNKVSVCSVDEALYLGADAVSIHINFGSAFEAEQIQFVANTAKECFMKRMPLMVMAYIASEDDAYNSQKIEHAARVALELGADIIKCNYTGTINTFSQITADSKVPILISGGPKMTNTIDLFNMVADAITAGAAGVAIGRNIFNDYYPEMISYCISKIVHESWSAQRAFGELNNYIKKNKIREQTI